MKPLSGYAKYQSAMAEFAAAYTKPAWDAKKRGERHARPTDSAFSSVFYGFTEISNTLDALALTETLIGLAAPRSKRVRKDEYLKFLIGAYLQEVYILEQRLTAYTKRISRLYRITGNISSLLGIIQNTFGGITHTRGSHVHSQRFSDQKLDLLSGLALISTVKDEFTFDMHFEYTLVQREWRRTVRENNAATRTFMDYYCDQLYPHVSRAGQIFLPRTGRGPAYAGKRAA